MRCVDTPQSIYDDPDNPRDVFDEVLGEDDTAPYYQVMYDALWARFRYHGIGSCNIDYWVRCMKDRYMQIYEPYMLKFTAWDKWLTDISDKGGPDWMDSRTETESLTAHEDYPDTKTIYDPDNPPEYLSDKNSALAKYKSGSGMESEQAARWM